MEIKNILSLLLYYLEVQKAKKEDFEELKKFISKTKVFGGKKKKMYSQINNFIKIKKLK